MQQRGNLYTFAFALVICLLCSVGLAFAATVLKPEQDKNAKLDIIVNILASVGYVDQATAEQQKDAKLVIPADADAVFKIFESKFSGVVLDKNDQEIKREVLEKELIEKIGYPEEVFKNYYLFQVLQLFNSKLSLLADKAKKSVKDYDPGYKLMMQYKPTGTVDAYILLIDGKGLWDEMEGYVAISPNMTIRGITFYKHKETPGLGGECEKPWFRNNYVGKKLFNTKGEFVSVKVAKGKAGDKYKAPELDHWVDGMSGATITGKKISEFMYDDIKKYVGYFKKLNQNSEDSSESNNSSNSSSNQPEGGNS